MSGHTIHCGWVSENLLAGNRGELSGAEFRSLTDHVATCEDCRRERDEMALLAQAIDSIPTIEPAAGSFSRLQEMMEPVSTEMEQPAAAQPRRGVLLAFGGALVAAAAGILLLLALLPEAHLAPPAPLTPLVGRLAVDGAFAPEGVEITPVKGTSLLAESSLLLLAFASPRPGEFTLAEGTELVCLAEGRYRLLSGRIFAEIPPGEGAFGFETPYGTVEVTGTTFDLSLTADRLTVAVATGTVLLRTGEKPVRVDSGTEVTVTAGGMSGAPRSLDPAAIGRWCSSPKALLSARGSARGGGLLLTLANETVRPLVLQPFDPSVGVYALRVTPVDGVPDGPEDVKLLEAMLTDPPAGRPRVLTLAPGEAYEIVIDPAKLGLSPGRYSVSAVYNPYTKDLPEDAWRGVLISPPVEVHIEDEPR